MKKDQKIVLFDIDYTIFNADKFREEVYSQLAVTCGTKYDDAFIQLTKQAETNSKNRFGYYDPKTFLEYIKHQTNTSITLVDLEKILWDDKKIASCLYDDVESVLQKLSQTEGVLLGTLSTGATHFQSKKIEILESYFAKEHIHIFANKLENMIQTIKKYEKQKLYIIDDLQHILTEVKIINPLVTTVLIKRQKKHQNHEEPQTVKPDFIISDFTQLLTIILSN